jgi:universal stress protein E
MHSIRRILVAVKNPDARSQPGVDKAIHLARTLGASVEFFHAISHTVLLEVSPLEGNSLGEIKREALALRTKRMDKLVGRARRAGVASDSSVIWDYPPYEAIVRRAREVDADLIIAECHEGLRAKPWLMRLTDWELLRLSPIPVLLLRTRRRWRQEPRILAAVDPLHAHDKPAALDGRIVDTARRWARPLGGKVTVLHANYPPLQTFVMSDPLGGAVTLAEVYEARKQAASQAFTRFADRHHVPADERLLIDSDPVHGIPRAAREWRADLVVMGAVSRSGLRRVFIGNTAERVLATLPCDVLVLKPLALRPKVAVAARPRGMRVAAMPRAPLPVSV